ARRLPQRQPRRRPRRAAGRPRLGAGPPRRPAGGPRLAVRPGLAVRRRAPGRRVRHGRRAGRRLRGHGRADRRPRRPALVGGAGHAQVGDHLHAPGGDPPPGRRALDRAGRDRPAGVRGRARPAPAAAGWAAALPPVVAPEPPAPGPRAGAPHDPPTTGQLVEAVREFLEGDVMAATEGRVRFHARVAARALAIVERELAAGDAPARALAGRLARLGVADEAELAAAIRAGDLDDRWDEVVAAVAATVADKLAVANPGYAEHG